MSQISIGDKNPNSHTVTVPEVPMTNLQHVLPCVLPLFTQVAIHVLANAERPKIPSFEELPPTTSRICTCFKTIITSIAQQL